MKAPLLFILAFLCVSSPNEWSRNKQQKFFPEELKKMDIYLGMTQEKFLKKRPESIPSEKSEFKIEFSESSSIQGIRGYSYLFSKSQTPLLYQISIHYDEMEGVHTRAEQLLGIPNHQGEWRIPSKKIKEDFDMGVWTFGSTFVYAGTVLGSELENGFQD